MAYTFLIYDFGGSEETAQQARRKAEGWKQGFRLGDKLLVKFEREDAGAGEGAGAAPEAAAEADAKEHKPAAGGKSHGAHKGAAGKKKSAERAAKTEAESAGRVRLLIRLDFSDHEKLSHNRWIAQIPAAEPFKSAKGEIIRSEDAAFGATAERFESLDRSAKGPRSQAGS